ncbi:transglutaminase TgpA family protein [Pseudonocardia zijingensis]|uniref:transglutaminase TgpA family protein n=1 Tax=Pseudonocardia zijingensis TaxID=153376 RepID=UPI00361F9E3C
MVLAGGPVTAVVQGWSWALPALAAVTVVVLAALVLHRFGSIVTLLGQCAAVLVVLAVFFGDGALLGFLPGPATFGRFGALVAGAGQQINTSTAPVAATPEILFLVTAAFGVLTTCVYAAAVVAKAPAAAGVPLLAVFAVPAALADQLLPWWAMAGAAAGFGLLLVAAGGLHSQFTGGTALVAGAVVVALGVGVITPFVGTSGRFANGGGGGETGSIGLTPFTALRGQLEQPVPTELFEVQGLGRPSYLRALTLRQYVPDRGWEATRPEPGIALPGPVQQQPDVPGEFVDVQIDNLAFRDYWLPLYGEPIDVADLPGDQWQYDVASGTGYTGRPRQDDGWRHRAVLPTPSMQQLRAAQGIEGVGLEYLDTTGVDPRVGEIAREVIGNAGPGFDRVFAIQNWFAGPGSQFTYSLQTAPGSGDDALVEFLTVGRTGYCEQFASAMAVMLRTVGVPARVAIGFTAGVDNGGDRTVSTSDAHAWVEAWFPRIGWTAFDPTPLTDGRRIDPPYVEEAQAELAQRENAEAEDAPVPEPLPGDDDTAPEPSSPEPSEPQATPPSSESSGIEIPIWPFAAALVGVLLVLVPAAMRVRHRRRRFAAVARGGEGAAGAGWDELLAESADRGCDTPPSDTVRAAARRLVREHHLKPDAQQALRQVVGAVESSWYGGAHPRPGELDEPVRTVAAGIAAGSSLSLRGRLLPRSVLQQMRERREGRERTGRRATEAITSR